MSQKETIIEKVAKFFNSVEQKRVTQIARRNILLERGRFLTLEEWRKRKRESAEVLKRISKALYPEKYGSFFQKVFFWIKGRIFKPAL
ncbi:MAG: hypothetical protein KC736_05175 [Candidatus Moranbacteria bacterium]|nr:hypothetical protein [Candidatus Moranbacteria bacterium]